MEFPYSTSSLSSLSFKFILNCINRPPPCNALIKWYSNTMFKPPPTPSPVFFILTPEPEISKSIDHRKKRWTFSKNLDNFRNENVSFTRKPRITPNNTFPILAHCVVCSPRTHKICINQGLHYYSKSTSMQVNM